MPPIIVNSALRDQLLAAKDVTEIRYETGEVVGQFVPKSLSLWNVFDGELPSDEELDRRLRESPRFSTEEVLERLRSLRRSQ